MHPKITVLMSVYNGGGYLPEAMDSILGQTFRDFEFLILDDGSTDETPAILAGYDDPRVRVVKNEQNLGLTRSLNRGLELAQGEYIARQDADDISLPERLEKEAAFLDANPSAVLVTGNVEAIDGAGNHCHYSDRALPSPLVAWLMHFSNHVAAHSLVCFRRGAAQGAGGYDETLPYAQDYDLWLRLLDQGDLAVLEEVLLKNRCHEDNISSKSFQAQFECALSVTARGLERLAGRRPSMEEAASLVNFWNPYSPGKQRISRTNRWLKQALRGFVLSRNLEPGEARELHRAVTALIARQYCALSKHRPFRHRVLSRPLLALMGLAWRWMPPACPASGSES